MSGFNHSIKVPSQYKRVAVILQTALDNPQTSLKSVLYGDKRAIHRIGSMHAVLKLYIQNQGAIDAAIKQTKILEENPRLKPSLCKILITELIFGRRSLSGESKPVLTVRKYKDRLAKELGVDPNEKVPEKKKDPKPRYVRINTNLLNLEEVSSMLAVNRFRLKKHDFFENYEDFLKTVRDLAEDEYIQDMHVDNLLIFHLRNKHFFATHAYTRQRKFMLQDKGTALVVELLRPPVGSTVLDMCAAPGMKTIHMCNVMKNQGTIYAIDQSPERYQLLCDMIETAGCNIVQTIEADALKITPEECPGVEYILVDPSCTGSGIQDRFSLEAEVENPDRLKKLAGLQIKMLSHAMSAFPDVKRIAYSTCSLHEEENEQVVQRCLQLNPNFKLLSGKKALRNKWQSVGSSKYTKIGKNCIYTKPEHDLTHGIFIAIFEKCSNIGE